MTRIEAARAALDAANKAMSAARAELDLALRDDWIERARAERPLAPGEVEGWLTTTGVERGEPPNPRWAVVRGRVVERLVSAKGGDIIVETVRQRRTDEDLVSTFAPYTRTYAGNTRECKMWRELFAKAGGSNA